MFDDDDMIISAFTPMGLMLSIFEFKIFIDTRVNLGKQIDVYIPCRKLPLFRICLKSFEVSRENSSDENS